MHIHRIMIATIRREAVFFAGLLACLIFWFIFLKFCSEVMEGESYAFDQAVVLAIRDYTVPGRMPGKAWFAEAMRDLTGLGGATVLSLIVVAVASYFLIMKKYGQAAYVVASVVLGSVFVNLLKIGFGRPRPEIIPHGSHTSLPGFPSGHSMNSAIVYLTLGAMLAAAHKGHAMRVYLMGIAIILTFLIGLSRIYLGVHWPSDVLAGWLGGAAWALMVWILYTHANREFWTRLRGEK